MGIIAGLLEPTFGTVHLNGEGIVDRERLAEIDGDYWVTQAILIEGCNQVRIYLPEGPPPESFRAAEPRLEDAYLLLTQENGDGPGS